MKKNVGGLDRNIRLLVGSVLILAVLFSPLGTGWRIGLGVVGAIAIITGFTGLCPLWKLLGISTYTKEK